MKILNFILCSLFSLNIFASSFSISLTVNGFGNQIAYLTKIEGDLAILIDTLTANKYGLFQTTFFDTNEVGFYKFIFPQLNNAEVPFIFNKENIALATEAIHPNSYIQVISSKENDLYYQFLAKKAIFDNQVSMLETVFNYYTGETFRKQAQEEYLRIIQEQTNDMAFFYEQGKNSFAWKVIKSSLEPFPPMLLSQAEKNIFLKAHFFDDVDFSDTSLINSEVFTSAAIQYLTIFSQQIQQSNKNSVFMSAVDTILTKASINKKNYDFIVDYLLGGFESMGASEIVTYISQKYLSEYTCSGGETTTLERKTLSNTKLAVGKNAPLDLLSAMDFKKDIHFSSENIVLFFWATWCEHCTNVLPQIIDHYANLSNPKFKIVTVSLDTTSTEWEKFIDNHPKLNKAKNLIDTQGWEGELAKEYYIYATPSIYMIQQGKIVAKPIEPKDYFEMIKRLKWD